MDSSHGVLSSRSGLLGFDHNTKFQMIYLQSQVSKSFIPVISGQFDHGEISNFKIHVIYCQVHGYHTPLNTKFHRYKIHRSMYGLLLHEHRCHSILEFDTDLFPNSVWCSTGWLDKAQWPYMGTAVICYWYTYNSHSSFTQSCPTNVQSGLGLWDCPIQTLNMLKAIMTSHWHYSVARTGWLLTYSSGMLKHHIKVNQHERKSNRMENSVDIALCCKLIAATIASVKTGEWHPVVAVDYAPYHDSGATLSNALNDTVTLWICQYICLSGLPHTCTLIRWSPVEINCHH